MAYIYNIYIYIYMGNPVIQLLVGPKIRPEPRNNLEDQAAGLLQDGSGPYDKYCLNVLSCLTATMRALYTIDVWYVT